MKKIILLSVLIFACETQTKKETCKFDGCSNSPAGWDNYQTKSDYYGPKYEGSFRLSEYGGAFCSQNHAIKALD
jgi:hypothetical protein